MERVPQETIDRIKRETNLVEYVESRGVKLKKAGPSRSLGEPKEYRGLCPFHEDTTPSFFINPVMKCMAMLCLRHRRGCHLVCGAFGQGEV